MCGIAGFIDLLGNDLPPDSTSILEDMVGTLRHRGPDESGVMTLGPAGLGHARLSIIDLSSGRQPIANEDESVWVTFNGEIFNYVELRRELEGRGHRFRTATDTEVIVHAYEEKGPACVEDFNGQFAFALWDGRKRRLLLARDRVGICPLFYTMAAGRLIFASEIKAILRHPGVTRRIDPRGLDEMFTFWTPVAPRTIFEGIRELPPASRLLAGDGAVGTETYWDHDFTPDSPARSEDEYVEEFSALFSDAVRIRLRADVPVGVYLSGGLDSSFVAAHVRGCSDVHLRTFSVGFDDPEFDESAYQDLMVRHLGTDHSSVRMAYDDIGSVFPRIVHLAERPTLRTAPAPLFHLSRLVRESGYKVVLTGEGSDEFLCGYNIFKEAKAKAFWARQPASTLRPMLLRRLYPYIKLPRDKGSLFLIKFFGLNLEDLGNPYYSHLVRWENTSQIKNFYSPGVREALAGWDGLPELSVSMRSELPGWDPVSRAQYVEARTFLPGYLLSTQGDRMLMGNSVEGRFPFLDHRIIELCNRIPARMKLKVLNEKAILKKAASGLLPTAITRRAKQPYRAPIAKSVLSRGGGEYVRELLSPRKLSEAGLFAEKTVGGLLRKIERAEGKVSERENMALVGILSTQLLHELFVNNNQTVLDQ